MLINIPEQAKYWIWKTMAKFTKNCYVWNHPWTTVHFCWCPL